MAENYDQTYIPVSSTPGIKHWLNISLKPTFDSEIYESDKETVIELLRERAREYVEDEAWAWERIQFWMNNR